MEPTTKRYDPFRRPAKPPLTLRPTEPLLDLLDRMQDFDILPRPYIHSTWYERNLVAQATKAHLIGIPDGWEHRDARNKTHPLELLPRGLHMLEAAGRYRPRWRSNAHDNHKYLTSVIDFSFRRAPIEISTLSFRSEDDIKNHPDTPPWEPTKDDKYFSAIPLTDYTIYPDSPFFGLNYDGLASMYFHREDDTGSERGRAKDDYTKANLRDKIRHYNEYLEAGMPWTRYGLKQITVLITTTKSGRVPTILSIIEEVCAPVIQKRFIVRSISDFLEDKPLPPQTAYMVTEDYFRIEDGSIRPFNILETLKRTAEKEGR